MTKSGALFFMRSHLRILAVLFALALSVSLLFNKAWAQTCAPISTDPININGVVVSPNVSGMGACPGDLLWRGVVGQNFTVFPAGGGFAGMESANIFIVGANRSGGTVGDVIIGVHTQFDPELNSLDKVVLFFDANNNATFDAGDFALAYEPSPLTPPVNIEDCDKAVGNLFFFKYNPAGAPMGSSNFWEGASLPAGITSRVAYDYNPNMPSDPENRIWELEIGLNIATLTGAGFPVNTPAAGPAFKMGAKLIMFEQNAMGSLIWRWPVGLTSDSDDEFSPNGDTVLNDVGHSAASLDQVTFDNCGDVIIESISSSAPTGSMGAMVANGFRLLTPGNAMDFAGGNGNTLPMRKTSFTASLRYQSSVPGNPTPTIGNPGTATFSIMPWGTNTGNALATVPMNQGSNGITFNAINVSQTMQFEWPPNAAAYAPVAAGLAMGASDHACYSVQLAGFPIDMPNANFVQRNLSYVETSTVKESFVISAERCDQKSPYYSRYDKECNKTQEYILRANWENVSPGQQCRHNPNAVEAAACGIHYQWTYIFPTAHLLGLKHLGNGYYRIGLKPGQSKRIPVILVGGKMPFEPQRFTLSPRAGGTVGRPVSGEPPRDIKVKPGQVVTIIANGLVFLSGGEKGRGNGPDGFSNRDTQPNRPNNHSSSPAAQLPPFLLGSRFYNPAEHIGALIGSWDGFRSSFVVGSNSTFIVPEGTDTLSLAINDRAGAFRDNAGPGFDVNIIISDQLLPPTRLVLEGNPALGVPGALLPGSNLPQLQLDLFLRVPTAKPKRALLRPAGNAVYAVYGSHLTKRAHARTVPRKSGTP